MESAAQMIAVSELFINRLENKVHVSRRFFLLLCMFMHKIYIFWNKEYDLRSNKQLNAKLVEFKYETTPIRIALTSCFSKTMDRMINKRLVRFLKQIIFKRLLR